MQKTFSFSSPRHQRARVVEFVKGDVRKYVQRERKKKLPAEFDEWTFTCRIGATRETAVSAAVKDLSRAIDAVAQTDTPSVFIEILAVPGHRPRRASAAPRLSW